VGQYRYVSFRVQPSQADSAFILGSLSMVPDTARLEVLLFHIDDFVRWRGRAENTDSLYYSRVTGGELQIPVDDCGDYYLVLSNRGSMTPVTVAARFVLHFSGSGVEYDSLKVALDLALILIAVATVAALIIRISGLAGGRKRRRRAG
jgi:hypothetical protein